MKKRIISAFILAIVFIPTLLIGGLLYDSLVVLITIIGLKELLAAKETKKKLPTFIKVICYTLLFLLLVTGIINDKTLTLNYTILLALFITLLTPTIVYHDRSKYSVNDAFYLIGAILFLGISMMIFMNVRSVRIALPIYLFLISIVTDTFALITGILIGKTKLLVEISPKKTWEGLIGGTIMGVIIPTMFYVMVIDPNISIWLALTMSLFLSLLGQIGDLIFSAIKRYYNVKDFSELIPGHGGILDRIDSIIFVMMGYMIFINFI